VEAVPPPPAHDAEYEQLGVIEAEIEGGLAAL
jgi:hypothetical protein